MVVELLCRRCQRLVVTAADGDELSQVMTLRYGRWNVAHIGDYNVPNLLPMQGMRVLPFRALCHPRRCGADYQLRPDSLIGKLEAAARNGRVALL